MSTNNQPSINIENKTISPKKKRVLKRVLSEKDDSDEEENKKSKIENLKSIDSKLEQIEITTTTEIKTSDETKIVETTTIPTIEQNVIIIDSKDYQPDKEHYHPINDACWNVPYSALSKTLYLIECISKRLEIIRILTNFYRSVLCLSKHDLLYCVYLCLNKLAPEYYGLELGIGDTIIMKAIGQSTGRTVEKLKTDFHTQGDLGLVAETSRCTQRTMFKPKPLTVSIVYTKLKEIAQMTGQSSQNKKIDIIKCLLVSCQSYESRYLVRSLTGKLRIGLAEQSLLVALAHAATITPPSSDYPPPVLNSLKKLNPELAKKKLADSALLLKTTYCECPSYDTIIQVLCEKGLEQLPFECKSAP
ncbi:unnamed protein product, partial [Didymodactylos carnosus]